MHQPWCTEISGQRFLETGRVHQLWCTELIVADDDGGGKRESVLVHENPFEKHKEKAQGESTRRKTEV